ncbi:MAG: ROK family protein [Thermovirgaceae bacterium]
MQIGIDLGGHTVRVALVEEGKILESARGRTPESRTPDDVLENISRMVLHLAAKAGVDGIGIGLPGMLDAGRSCVLRMPNFPGWEGFDLKAEAGRFFGVPVVIENDANCYALGEGTSGAARGLEDYVVFTVGTGIGGGVVLGGALLKGSHGMAGELGHAAVGGVRPCGCGGVGHAESIAGADGIEKAFAALGISGELSELWCERKRPPYTTVWGMALDALARTVATAVHFFDPQAVVVGGGLSRGEGFIEELHDVVTAYLADPFRATLDLRPSLLGNDAAVIGAAALARDLSIS